jgi:AraC-like DNA-binding protein
MGARPSKITTPPAGDVTEYVVTMSDIHPRDRFDYWFETTCRAYVPYECTPRDRNNFDGELRTLSFAGLLLSTCGSNGMTTWRTERQAAQTKESTYVYIQLTGDVSITQNGREAVLRSGDFTLVDCVGANSFVHSAGSKSLVLELSRKDCEARLGHMGQWTARRVDGSAGVGALASNFVQQLPKQCSLLNETAQTQVALQVIDLLALALREGEGSDLLHSSVRLVSLLRLKAAVDANLTNSSVTCDDLAAAAGISIRYANQLLDAEQTSLQRLLFNRRIAKCQAALADPAQVNRQISDIAYSWGFGDVSHFGRLFKAVTGLTPRDFRRQKLASPQNL